MKKRKLISLLCAAAMVISAAAPASAVTVSEQEDEHVHTDVCGCGHEHFALSGEGDTDTESPPDVQPDNLGTIKFDPGDWNSERISFFIWDESEEDVKAATKDGWVDIDKFPEDDYELVGGKKLSDGTFESFTFEIPRNHVVFVQFFDPDRDLWTYDCVLTKDALDDTASLTGESVKWRESDDYSFHEVKFKDSGLTTRLYYNWNGELIGKQVHPYLDRAQEVAILIYGFSNHMDENGKCVVTPEKVKAAMDAFGVSPDEVYEKYLTFKGYDDRYSEEFAKSVLYPEGAPDDPKPSVPTYTYYFLAPDDWFKTDKGALNEDIGFYAWTSGEGSDENAPFPGEKMTPAPEIGENVFKLETERLTWSFGVFNDCAEHDPGEMTANLYTTAPTGLKGYKKGECPYNSELTTESFNNWIYVLDLDPDYTTAIIPPYEGQWFTLDDYKNHDDYYGTYKLDKKNSKTYYFLAPESWFKLDKGALNENVGFYAWSGGEGSRENAPYPGEKMTPAPEIGENVFKITVEDPGFESAEFTDYIYADMDTDPPPEGVCSSYNVYFDGYEETDCPYDETLTCDSFDGWIYVLDLYTPTALSEYHGYTCCPGAWFRLDDYKNCKAYYGTYPEYKETNDEPDPIPEPHPAPDIFYGDLDGDGMVTSTDALAILRASVGMAELSDELFRLADVDFDESLTSTDALTVLRYSVGIPIENTLIGQPA